MPPIRGGECAVLRVRTKSFTSVVWTPDTSLEGNDLRENRDASDRERAEDCVRFSVRRTSELSQGNRMVVGHQRGVQHYNLELV